MTRKEGLKAGCEAGQHRSLHLTIMDRLVYTASRKARRENEEGRRGEPRYARMGNWVWHESGAKGKEGESGRRENRQQKVLKRMGKRIGTGNRK